MHHYFPEKSKHLSYLRMHGNQGILHQHGICLDLKQTCSTLLLLSPGGHIKYDWVQTETDYILLWKNVGNTDSLALVLYGYFKEGIIQQL